MGLFDWALLEHNCPIFHSAGSVNPIEKLSNCQKLQNKCTGPLIRIKVSPRGLAKHVELKMLILGSVLMDINIGTCADGYSI